ncbi:MAG: tetratricopeptide repeat protein, partial [bacterium]
EQSPAPEREISESAKAPEPSWSKVKIDRRKEAPVYDDAHDSMVAAEDVLKDAIMHYIKGNYKKAAQELTALLNRFPYYKDGYRLLGSIYSKLNKISAAIKIYLHYQKLDPHNTHVHENAEK